MSLVVLSRRGQEAKKVSMGATVCKDTIGASRSALSGREPIWYRMPGWVVWCAMGRDGEIRFRGRWTSASDQLANRSYLYAHFPFSVTKSRMTANEPGACEAGDQ